MTKNKGKNLIRGTWLWTKEDIELLKRFYPKGNTKMIAEKLGRPLTAVRQKAYDIGMKTDTYNYWTEDDLKILVKLYPDTKNDKLARRFRRPEKSIIYKASKLGLKKSQSHMKTFKSRPRKQRKKKA